MNTNKVVVDGYCRQVLMDFVKRDYVLRSKPIASRPSSNLQIEGERFCIPSIISNAIVDIDKHSENINAIDSIFSKLQLLLCRHIVVRIIYPPTLKDIQRIFEASVSYNIHEMLLITNFAPQLYSNSLARIVLDSNRLKAMVVFNSPFNKNLDNIIHFYKRKMPRTNFKKDRDEFICNHWLYNESIRHNTYFHKKLYIDAEGQIKNAPECSNIFGQIAQLSPSELLELVRSEEFAEFWHITKDMCCICSDCEYKHMCVDNRVPYSNGHGMFRHRVACTYNPYIARWQGQPGYVPVEQCGVFTPEGFVPDAERIEQVLRGTAGE